MVWKVNTDIFQQALMKACKEIPVLFIDLESHCWHITIVDSNFFPGAGKFIN